MNILAPGDVLVIPDLRPGETACETDHRHTFRRIGVPMLFRLQLLEDGQPRQQVLYVLELADTVLKGYTDAQGCIARYIPNDTLAGRLIVDDGVIDVRLQFGHMDPAGTDEGVRKRLFNLGFAAPPEPDGLRAAVRRFQHDSGLPETGHVDDQTRGQLLARHDQIASAVTPAGAAAKDER
ncbi:peptidoglycan-binding domain-containing protein [Pseudoduganella sp. LjRoot289]|uniref:peptidoglycan-binding domain-containing protein n=1 Tax=Pseudoduganella sp. LjRoot289 TaxID=3342314 RepID=UPI003ECF8BB1